MLPNNHTIWPAPAKLNLFLHVTGRRDDGFHELQTVFQFLEYGDELQFSLRDDGLIQRTTEIPGIEEDEDLVVRAARLLQQTCHKTEGVDIAVNKVLPLGGGLGGGSSDAATTLVALNQLWDCGLSKSRLTKLGLALGADVPVFIYGQAAWAEGVGERLQPVTLPESWYLVLVPPVAVSTAEIFSSPNLNRTCAAITIRDFLMAQGTDQNAVVNVCEPLVRERYPEVDEAFSDLSRFGDPHMTGTGSCIFAAFARKAEAQAGLAELSGKWQGFVAQAKNTSSLYGIVAL